MFEVIRFALTAFESGEDGRVFFIASVNGQPVRCSISGAALEHCFDSDPAHHEPAFHKHRREIEEAAEVIIRVRGINSGELRIEESDLNSALVAFGRPVRSTSLIAGRLPPKG